VTAEMVDERAVRLALDTGQARLRIQKLETDNASLRDQLGEAWDEVERLRGVVERLKIEKHDLAERLSQAGSDPS
jgi:FtsZ-binding cell division protein ZapB